MDNVVKHAVQEEMEKYLAKESVDTSLKKNRKTET